MTDLPGPEATAVAQTRAAGQPRSSQRRRLALVLTLNLSMIAGLVIVGLLAHSLGVLAAGGDYIADSAAITLGLVAVTLRDRIGSHSRAPTIVALINATALLTVTGLVVAEAIHRLTTHAPHVSGLPVLIISSIATLVMIGGILILGPDSGEEDLHMRSVLLDTAADAAASAGVAITGAIIWLRHGLYWLDPAAAIAVSAIIAAAALALLRDATRALLATRPSRRSGG